MKKVFYICLAVFFTTGISLFYLIDKNYLTLKSKFNEQNINGSISINSDDEKVVLEKNYKLDNEKLNINLDIGNVTIEKYDGSVIKIKSTIPQKSMRDYKINEENRELSIDGSIAEEIVIKIPRDKMLEGNINVGVGNIRAENLKNAIIGLSTGDFEAKNIDGFQKVNLNLGSIKISNSKNISIIKLGTGDITLDIIEQNRDFLIENGMGDVDLNINNMFDGKIETHVGLGDIRETNMKANGNKYNGTVELGTGDLSIEGVDYNGKEIN